MANEDTILMGNKHTAYARKEDKVEQKKENGKWKKVAIGATSGILVGAGAIYAATALGSDNNKVADVTDKAEDVKVAKVSDDDSFDDAFNSARAQVGPGGVFRWHDGIYSTYNDDEWNTMSDSDKAQFAQAVCPEVRADEIAAERMSAEHPQPVIVKVETTQNDGHEAGTQIAEDDVQMIGHSTATNNMAYSALANNTQVDQSTDDDDVQVVGTGIVQGHQAVALDMTGNGEADVAIIDINDNNRLDDQDVAVFRDGTTATMHDVAAASSNQGTEDSNNDASDIPTQDYDPSLQQASFDDQTPVEDYGTGVDDAGNVDDGSGFVNL